MSGWADNSATHGKVTFTRSDDDSELVIGEGGALKAKTLHAFRGYGSMQYSNVPTSDQNGESPRRPTLGPLVFNLTLMLRGDVSLFDGSDVEDPVAGMQANLGILANFCRPFATGTGTFTTQVIVPAYTGTLDGDAQLELMLADSAPEATFVTNLPLLVTIPAGSLTFTPEP